MADELIPGYLQSVLRHYYHVELYGIGDWREALSRELHHPSFPNRAVEFQNALAEAILYETITLAEYEKLTGEEFDNQEELNRWLRELWRELYGYEPPPRKPDEATVKQ